METDQEPRLRHPQSGDLSGEVGGVHESSGLVCPGRRSPTAGPLLPVGPRLPAARLRPSLKPQSLGAEGMIPGPPLQAQPGVEGGAKAGEPRVPTSRAEGPTSRTERVQLALLLCSVQAPC